MRALKRLNGPSLPSPKDPSLPDGTLCTISVRANFTNYCNNWKSLIKGVEKRSLNVIKAFEEWAPVESFLRQGFVFTTLLERLNSMKMNSKNRQDLYEKLTKVELELDKMLDGGEKAIKVHLLHQYNDVKDAAQIVISYIANVEGTTVTEIHKRLNLSE